MQRRTLIRTALASSLATGLPAAFAQGGGNWPTGNPITYLVPFPAGGTTDVLGRLIAQKLGPVLGTSVIIDNKGARAAAWAPKWARVRRRTASRWWAAPSARMRST